MIVAGKDIEAAYSGCADGAGSRYSPDHGHAAPPVDIITGTIKANFPDRISIQGDVQDRQPHHPNEQGAEQLLGQGDMLSPADRARCCGSRTFVSDERSRALRSFCASMVSRNNVDGVTDGAPDAGKGSPQPWERR